MTHKNNKENFNGIIAILKDLNKKYPLQGIARHIHDATLDYSNLWGLEDKELLFSLTKYKTELDLNVVDEKEIDAILKDGILLNDNIETYLIEDQEWDNEG